MCCCGCCSKLLKCVCGIVWSVIALALIVVLIIIAVAWGGSGVAQDVVKNLINCNGQTYSKKNCPENFGDYIEEICDEGNYTLECYGPSEAGQTEANQFKYLIDFKPMKEKNLGAFIRMSNKGIENNNTNIIALRGYVDHDSSDKEAYQYNLTIPTYTKDIDGNAITDKKKQYIVHNSYAHIEIIGECLSGSCGDEEEYTIVVEKASLHIRLSFKTVPDWINVHIDDDQVNYDEFVEGMYKVIKPFSKSAAKTMKEAMTTLKIRVKDFNDSFGKQVYCSISPDFDPTYINP